MWSSKYLFSGCNEDFISWVMVKLFRVVRE